MPDPDDKEFAKTLAKGLEVLAAFDRETPGMTISEVANRFGFNRAVARRIVRTLEILGYLKQERRVYSLTPRVLRLGYGYLASNKVGNVIHPILKQVTAEIDEPCSMGVLDGNEVVYVAHSPGEQRHFSVGLTVGSRLPLLTTATGRALLSRLPGDHTKSLIQEAPLVRETPKTEMNRDRITTLITEARQQGYAYVEDEVEIGLASVAVPVVSPAGTLIGAINVVVNNGRVDESTLRSDYASSLKRCAAHLAAALG